MSRKTRREPRREKKNDDTVEDFIKGPAEGLNEDEISEIIDFIPFHDNFIDNVAATRQSIDINYPFSLDALKRYFARRDKQALICETMRLTMYSTVLTDEAYKKGFNSLLAYVRFLKLTLLEEEGVYRIVSEEEQKQVKQWVLMRTNFKKKYGICIELVTPDSDEEDEEDLSSMLD